MFLIGGKKMLYKFREHNNDINLRAGIIIQNSDGDILIEKPTNAQHIAYFAKLDIPKGHLTKGETTLEGAIREVKEETGLKFTQKDLKKLGSYILTENNGDEVPLTLYYTKRDADIKDLNCSSTFQYKGKTYKEVESFKWLKPILKNLDKFQDYLQPTLKDVFLTLKNVKLKESENNSITFEGPIKCSEAQQNMNTDEFSLSWDQMDKEDTSSWYRVYLNNQIISYISYYPENGCCHIYSFEIKKSLRGEHLGAKVLSKFMDLMRSKGFKSFKLVPMDGDPKLQKFYAGVGFKNSDEKAYDDIPYMKTNI
jgi:8-oxo-dGTP pyrophosphatase MutT (NUDIX family)/predicted GNAT family N-acyltransferase